MTILVTGSAGFIGANFVLDWLAQNNEAVISLDKLTYAGNAENLKSLDGDTRHTFVKGDIGDSELITELLKFYQPRAVINFAAESHVDRSILGPEDFIQTNIVGTFRMLEAVRAYHGHLSAEAAAAFRFLHVSTDEVYGSLSPAEPAFTEQHQYEPNSPYSASKAASDHLVRAYHHTYGLPVLTTNCSNNYGPYHFPEKLIPLVIHNALAGKPLPIYGDGQQVRIGSMSKITAVQFAESWKAAPSVRRITSAAGTKRPISTLYIPSVTFSTKNSPATMGTAIASRLPSSRIGQAMIGVMPSMPANSSVSWAGSRRKPSKAESVKQCVGIWVTGTG